MPGDHECPAGDDPWERQTEKHRQHEQQGNAAAAERSFLKRREIWRGLNWRYLRCRLVYPHVRRARVAGIAVVVDRAIPGIKHHLDQGMRVRLRCARTQLHWQQDQGNEHGYLNKQLWTQQRLQRHGAKGDAHWWTQEPSNHAIGPGKAHAMSGRCYHSEGQTP